MALGSQGGAPPTNNEPAGMALISNRPFSAVDEGGWDDSWGSLGTIVTDATAPESPSNVLQMHLPAGFGEGGGPCSGDLTFPTNYRTVYVRYSAKFSAGWQGPSSGIDKAFYIYDDLGHPTIIFDMDGDGFVDKSPMVAGQDIIHAGSPSPGGDLANPFWPPNVDSTLIPRGEWFTVEFVAVSNTSGSTNGTLDWWVNGVKKGAVTGIQFATGSRLWNLLHYTEIYTGTSGTRPASAQNVYWDNLYVSGK